MKYFHEDKVSHLKVCRDLMANYKQIRKEVLEFIETPSALTNYPKYPINGYDTLYENYWKAAPISAFRNEHVELMGTPEAEALLKQLTENTRKHCPTIVSIISDLENKEILANSFISRLLPGTVINPHVGWSNQYMRVHLGLVCDPGCRMTIGDESNTWQEGKLLAFVDGPPHAHAVEHKGTKERIVLSFDIRLDHIGFVA